MKRTNFSRFIAIGVVVAMSVGCITLNTFAEEFTSDIEVVTEDEVPVVEEEIIGEEVVVEEEMIVEEDIFLDSFEEEEIFSEEPMLEVEDDAITEELDIAGGELLFGDQPEEIIQPEITLNYEEYALDAVGKTVLLVAEVTGLDTLVEEEPVVEEPVAEEPVVEEPVVEEVVDEAAGEAEAFGDEFVIDIEEETFEDVAGEEIVEEEPVETVEEELVLAEDEMIAVDVVTEVVSWTSSDEAVATVDEIGLVTAVASGEAIITCTLNADQNVVATCKITVETGCVLPEHVHSFEECLVRELICEHVNEMDHTADCFYNYFCCGFEEHVHNEECFEETADTEETVDTEETIDTEETVDTEEFVDTELAGTELFTSN